jgi:peptide/nickel transport system permease protein
VPQVVDAAPVTFSLVLGASVLWVTFAIALGLIAAVYRGRTLDAVVMIVGLIGISMPVFWLGEVVNMFTQSRLHDTFLFSWVPPLGYVPFTQSPVGWFKALLLPWLTLSILYIGLYARVLRSALVESQEEDYVRTARSKGMSERRVVLWHAARNSMLPVITILGMDAGLAFAGAIFIERTFNLPGLGRQLLIATNQFDLPMVCGIVVFVSLIVITLNLIVDIAYGILDPRIRLTEAVRLG